MALSCMHVGYENGFKDAPLTHLHRGLELVMGLFLTTSRDGIYGHYFGRNPDRCAGRLHVLQAGAEVARGYG